MDVYTLLSRVEEDVKSVLGSFLRENGIPKADVEIYPGCLLWEKEFYRDMTQPWAPRLLEWILKEDLYAVFGRDAGKLRRLGFGTGKWMLGGGVVFARTEEEAKVLVIRRREKRWSR